MDIWQATEWEQVQQYAALTTPPTCIRPRGLNHDKAKRTWDEHRERVRYYLLDATSEHTCGYMRVLRTNTYDHLPATWVGDWVQPYLYELIELVARQLQPEGEGGLFVTKRDVADKHLAEGWPQVTLKFPEIGVLPWSQWGTYEQSCLLVIPRVREMT